MIGAHDALGAKHLALMEAAQQAGEDVRPHIIDTYAAFASNAAESWWLAISYGHLPRNVGRLKEAALHDILDIVAQLNAESFGRTDRALDRQCCAAVREAFAARVRDLQAGVRP